MTEDPLTQIIRKDPRYSRAAYEFVREALRETIDDAGEPRHVSARELLHGVRDLAQSQFGPLARTVLSDWGVHRTDDIGQIVFNLIDVGEFGKNDDDHLSDFSEVFEFDKAFPPVPDEAQIADDDDDDDDWDDVTG